MLKATKPEITPWFVIFIFDFLFFIGNSMNLSNFRIVKECEASLTNALQVKGSRFCALCELLSAVLGTNIILRRLTIVTTRGVANSHLQRESYVAI